MDWSSLIYLFSSIACIIIIINISYSIIDNSRNSGIKSTKLFWFMRIAFSQLCKIATRFDMTLKIRASQIRNNVWRYRMPPNAAAAEYL